MSKKLTHEEFMAKVIEKNEHVRNGEIEIRGKYNGKDNPIECYCIVHNVVWSPKPSTLYKGCGCQMCGDEKISKSNFMSRDEFVEKLKATGNPTTLYGDYKGIFVDTEFLCPVGHIFTDRPATVLHGNVLCPYCSGRRVLVGFNDLWTTHPEVAAMLTDPNDGYSITKGTNSKKNFTCPLCGKKQDKYVVNVVRRGLQCSNCSDHITFPNRFGRSLLNQLPIDMFIPEYHPDWLKPYRYDNYFQYNNKEYILEMDGGIGHGNKQWFTGQKDVEGKKIDELKDSLAAARGIKVIRIDAKESSKEYIQKHILISELNSIFDLSLVDWNKCEQDAQKNLVKEACELYMSRTNSLVDMAEKLKISTQTVRIYLKKGAKFGWCDYYPNTPNLIHKTIERGKRVCVTNIYTGEQFTFINVSYCEREILDVCGIKVGHTTIRKYCEAQGVYKDFIFKFIE
jgi:hypothetical protein